MVHFTNLVHQSNMRKYSISWSVFFLITIALHDRNIKFNREEIKYAIFSSSLKKIQRKFFNLCPAVKKYCQFIINIYLKPSMFYDFIVFSREVWNISILHIVVQISSTINIRYILVIYCRMVIL